MKILYKGKCTECKVGIVDWIDYVKWENDYKQYHGWEIQCPYCKKSFWIWVKYREQVHTDKTGAQQIQFVEDCKYYVGNFTSPDYC